MLKIFISHSTRDYKLVTALEVYLKIKGILTYIAENDCQVGRSLSSKIIENLEKSDYFLVLYTNKGKESDYVNQEIGYWIKARGFTNLIPLVEKGIIPEGFLSGCEYFELDPKNHNIGLDKIVDYLVQKKEEYEIELFGDNIVVGLGLLGLTALILYGIYVVVKE
ncbi:MAG: toll/interleukin-1 receptor domain-containing protein [Patescibacteria group bacterium]|nr:toll/interleukin-1 receptor domain-containing protein [Patescibacteria group bacterium]